jgi:hypothetical protein
VEITIPSSGKFNVYTSPEGTSAINKVVPELDVVVNSNIPAPPPSEETEIALSLIGPAITAVPVLASG